MIVANAGRDGSVVVEMVSRQAKEKNDKNIGYDVLGNDYADMLERGIIDPAKVTRSAIEEGIVPGGGVALINAGSSLDKIQLSGDEATGVALVRRALEEPMRQLAANAGMEGSVIVDGVQRQQAEKKNNKIGFNVLSNQYVDMIQEGIIDPAKVTRSAVQNAASVANMILTTEALITDIPEEKQAAPAAPPMY